MQWPVTLWIVRILGPGQRRWDADSVLRGSAKELVDAMVDAGWFPDDGPRYIRLAIGDQDDTRRQEGPATEIIIQECET